MAQVYLKRTSETLGMRTCNEIILLLILLIHRTRRRKAMILQVQDMFCCPVITENKQLHKRGLYYCRRLLNKTKYKSPSSRIPAKRGVEKRQRNLPPNPLRNWTIRDMTGLFPSSFNQLHQSLIPKINHTRTHLMCSKWLLIHLVHQNKVICQNVKFYNATALNIFHS